MSEGLTPAAAGATGEQQEDDDLEYPGDGAGRGTRLQRIGRSLQRPETAITLIVVLLCSIFVFVEMQPSKLFLNTTPAGGDMGAHVWLPAYIKRSLLPHFQIFGWTMDWYAGFPALTYYFPLPMVAIAVTSYVIPYNVSFKLISVAGILTLPLACWAFGRLSRVRFPTPACLAVAAVPFLWSRDFTIYGGNIASTMAGEFSFSISLSFAMVFLGLVGRGMKTGRNRALAAVVLALCGLSHILPLFFALVGAGVWFLMTGDWRRLRWSLPVLVTGGLLIAFWALPYEYRLPYATNMGYGKITTYISTLFPGHDLWLFIGAGIGVVLAFLNRNRIGVWLFIMAILSALAFRYAPNARLWNARWLPFWFLSMYLLMGVAFAEVGTVVVALVRGRNRIRGWSVVPIPVVTLLVGLAWTGFPLRILPFGHVIANGNYDWLGISSADDSYVPGWVDWNYSGYQSPGKSSRTTYFALINEMKTLGATPGDGCGRVMYEYESSINDMGTSDALMLLPYWTDGCMATMEGLYYESSATTPFHFLNVSELSDPNSAVFRPSDPMTNVDYSTTTQLQLGIQHLQMFGVNYFMAVDPAIERMAAKMPDLKLLASVGPYATDVTNASNQTVIQNQTWKIYKVMDAPLVQPLTNQPVVMKDVAGTKWLGALTDSTGEVSSQDSPAESWYLNPKRWSVYETDSGPKSWARVDALDTTPPKKPEPSTTVSDVKLTEEAVSFNVSRVGVPVLVKVSYFPNWQVSGAEGVYRATPNLMIVVPTSHHVSLTYGYTPVDWTGLGLSVIGLVCVVVMARRPQPQFRRPRVGAHASATMPYGEEPPLWWGRVGDDRPRTRRPAIDPSADDDYPVSWDEWDDEWPTVKAAPDGPKTASDLAASPPPPAWDDEVWLAHHPALTEEPDGQRPAGSDRSEADQEEGPGDG
jgi:hypothetical protein